MNLIKFSKLGIFFVVVYLSVIALAFVSRNFIAYAIFITILNPFFKLHLISGAFSYVVASMIMIGFFYFIGCVLGSIYSPGSFKLSK